MNTGGRKTSKGRQKIEMKPIANEEARQVCFSKRRSGLFKKATELSILCGAEVVIVVFSPAGKPFSYGHPSTNSVADRYLSSDGVNSRGQLAEARSTAAVGELNRKYAELKALLEAEKKKKVALEAQLKRECWTWDLDGCSLEVLEKLGEGLEKQRSIVRMMRNQADAGARSRGHANNDGSLIYPPPGGFGYGFEYPNV